jgi:hypothetical protein
MGVIYAVKGINTIHAFYGMNIQYAFSGISDVHARRLISRAPNSPTKHRSLISIIDGAALAFEVIIPFFKGF